MRKLRAAVVMLLCVCIALPLAGCGQEKFEKQIYAMNTTMTLTAYGKNAETGLSGAVSLINSLDAMLDPENEGSMVNDMNNANGEGTVVNNHVVTMLKTAQTVYTQSGGALNPAIYPVVKAWGFVDCNYRIPSDDELTELLQNIDFSKVKITSFTETGSYLVTMPAGMQISFGAVAKGYTASQVIATLRAAGVTSAIISLGGNVQTLGAKPDGSNWAVAIQDPNDTGSYIGILTVGETAVVTSGGYNRYFDGEDGVRYEHIIDPDTGKPVNNGLKSVTVVCDDGTMADALSTALYVMGEKAALNYYSTYGGFEMILVTDDGRVVITNGLYEAFESYGSSYSYEYAS